MKKINRVFDVELRTKENEERTVEGYAVVFNAEADIGWFTEEIDRNAFRDTDMSDVYLLFNHDENNVLAGTSNGSLKMSIDDRGLFQSSEIVDTTTGEDVFKLVKNGLIKKMSFAFAIDENDKEAEEWDRRDGKEHRVIKRISKLFDVSLVTYPAYEQTSAYARSLTDELAEEHKRRELQSERMERILNGKDSK